MIKFICDRCGKEITETCFHLSVISAAGEIKQGVFTRQLCPECEIDLRLFLNSAPDFSNDSEQTQTPEN